MPLTLEEASVLLSDWLSRKPVEVAAQKAALELHEKPSPLLDRFSRKPPGSRFDLLNLQAKLRSDPSRVSCEGTPNKC
jgi:hypothetical protein